MNELEIAVSLAVLVITYTSSVGAMVLWLANKFRQLEKLIYKEMEMVRKENMSLRRDMDRRIEGLGLRLQRLELRLFGFTQTPVDEPPYTRVDQFRDPRQSP